MATKSCRSTLSILAVLQVFLALSNAADTTVATTVATTALPVSTSLDDYIAQNERSYTAVMSGMSSQLNDFRDDYNRQVNALAYNKELVETQLSDNEQRLYALSFLNDQRKYCVQKYISQLVTVTTFRTAFTTCITDALNTVSALVATPTNTFQGLQNWWAQNWKAGLTTCQRSNAASYQNQSICVANYIVSVNNIFASNQKIFNTQMDASQCAATSRIRLTSDCVFGSTNSALASVGLVTKYVDDCVNGVGSCPPCTPLPQCPNTVTVVTDSVTFTNATYKNPFQGLTNTAECVLVNFKKS